MGGTSNSILFMKGIQKKKKRKRQRFTEWSEWTFDNDNNNNDDVLLELRLQLAKNVSDWVVVGVQVGQRRMTAIVR